MFSTVRLRRRGTPGALASLYAYLRAGRWTPDPQRLGWTVVRRRWQLLVSPMWALSLFIEPAIQSRHVDIEVVGGGSRAIRCSRGTRYPARQPAGPRTPGSSTRLTEQSIGFAEVRRCRIGQNRADAATGGEAADHGRVSGPMTTSIITTRR